MCVRGQKYEKREPCGHAGERETKKRRTHARAHIHTTHLPPLPPPALAQVCAEGDGLGGAADVGEKNFRTRKLAPRRRRQGGARAMASTACNIQYMQFFLPSFFSLRGQTHIYKHSCGGSTENAALPYRCWVIYIYTSSFLPIYARAETIF